MARPFEKVPSSTLNVTFSGLQLEKWADVWPMPLPFKLERALLDSNLRVVFEQPAMRRPRSGWWATWACASSTCATSRAPSWRPGAR